MIILKDRYKGQILIAIGAIIWGTQGPFAQLLMNEGASPLLVSTVKLGLGAMWIFLAMAIFSPRDLKIDRKGLILTGVIGLISQAGFNYLYYNSVQLIGIANGAVILYTSPVFFLILSVLWFKEKLTGIKLSSALLCVLGCAIAVTGGSFDFAGLSMVGIGMALLSAASFALMGGISKKALMHYAPMTIIAYSFFWGFLFLLPQAMITGAFCLPINGSLLVGAIGIGAFPAALAYYFYFKGVGYGVNLSQAGVISSLEMVSAVLIAWTLFAEPVSLIKILGVSLILVSIGISEIRK